MQHEAGGNQGAPGVGEWRPPNAPPGWYRDPADPSTVRWWDGGSWTGAAGALGPAAPGPPATRAPTRRRRRRWITVLSVSVALGIVAFVLLIAGGVRIDQSTGHFGRITVPGESYGLPDEGTYVITDGSYAAAMHRSPTFVVTGPQGEDVPVEPVPSHRYGHEDNALAIFHVTTRGRHRLQVSVPEGADRDVPTTVTVDRSMDGSGDPLTSAYLAVGVGLLLGLISAVVAVIAVVKLVRLASRGAGARLPA